MTWAMHLTLNAEMDLRRVVPLVLRATGQDQRRGQQGKDDQVLHGSSSWDIEKANPDWGEVRIPPGDNDIVIAGGQANRWGILVSPPILVSAQLHMPGIITEVTGRDLH